MPQSESRPALLESRVPVDAPAAQVRAARPRTLEPRFGVGLSSRALPLKNSPPAKHAPDRAGNSGKHALRTSTLPAKESTSTPDKILPLGRKLLFLVSWPAGKSIGCAIRARDRGSSNDTLHPKDRPPRWPGAAHTLRAD